MVFVCIFCKRKCDRSSGLSLFKFPVSSQGKMKVWLESLNVPEPFKVSTNTRICSDNFESKNFFCGMERTKLGRDAVPKLRCVSSEQTSDTCSDVEIVYSVPSASSLSGNLNTCLVADFELHVQMNSEDLPPVQSSGDYMAGSENRCFTSTAHEGERATEATEGSLVEAGLPPTQGPDAVMEKQDANNVTFVTGYFLDLVKWMSADRKFNYFMVKIENLESFATITKEMSLKDIDFALPSYAVSSERKSLATFLYPTQISEYTLVLPYPKRESDPWSCLKPFTYSVWLCIAVCVLLIPFLMKITTSVKEVGKRGFGKLHPTLWADASVYVLGVITNQGGHYSSKNRTSRFIAAIWCLGAVVLVNAYSSLLITYLTTPKLSLLVRSIGELAERDDIQVLVQKGSFIRRQLESAEGSLRPIRANMERIPDNYCGSVWESKREYCIDQVKKGGFAYVSSMEQAEDVINADFAKTKTCSLTYIQNTFSPHYAAFIAPVNVSHDLRNSLDVSILRAISYGLIEKFQSFYYTKNESPCSRYRSQDQQLKKLSLVDFTSAFILLAIGCSLSLVALAYELATRRPQKPWLSR